ncbi:hypothetical protein ACN38_g12976 [Penicillium nordicum]|uniref:Uncharacterized protein n=1 Tax=Penicillium nordicum TaxID=229535 RepID=A0A0M9W9G9_9EURO|nr:hypothetical protein ACN38_g12976 [Penicillium nordicum]
MNNVLIKRGAASNVPSSGTQPINQSIKVQLTCCSLTSCGIPHTFYLLLFSLFSYFSLSLSLSLYKPSPTLVLIFN